MADYTAILPNQGQITLVHATNHKGEVWEKLMLLIAPEGASLEVRRLIGGDSSPEPEWSRRVAPVTIASASAGSAAVDLERLRTDLAGGVLAELIDRVRAGHRVMWTGDTHEGLLTDDAAEALASIEELDYVDGGLEAWTAAEYALGADDEETALDRLGLATDATDGEIQAAARALIANAARDRIVLAGDPVAAIRDLIEAVRAERGEA